MFKRVRSIATLFLIMTVSACATPGFKPEMRFADAELNPVTVTEHTLKWLPGPRTQIPVAVYGLADETGAFKPSEGSQTLSRAVTQAPTPILMKALQDAGNRRWFSVIERENLQNLLKERQIIIDMRRRYLGEEDLNREALPALRFAGILIEGAITGYDTNTVTGGAGARYLGIGGATEYREDTVSVYLRAVSVRTGEVLVSITSEQRVASVAAQGNAFRFVAFQEILEAEAGLTMNQPRHMAVRQAIEKAVYGMIVEGAELGLWAFGDEAAGQAAITHYRSAYAPAYNDRYDGLLPPQFFAAEHRQEQERLASARGQVPPRTQQTPPAPQRAAQTATQSQPQVQAAAASSRQQASVSQSSAPRVVTAQSQARTPSQPAERTAEPPTARSSKPQERGVAASTVSGTSETNIMSNRALADALTVLSSLEGEEGPVTISPDLANSLHALGKGEAGIRAASQRFTASTPTTGVAVGPNLSGAEVSPP